VQICLLPIHFSKPLLKGSTAFALSKINCCCPLTVPAYLIGFASQSLNIPSTKPLNSNSCSANRALTLFLNFLGT